MSNGGIDVTIGEVAASLVLVAVAVAISRWRRAELEAADGFSADMGRVGGRMIHCEDTEFCIRVTADRPEAVILHRPEAVVRHYVPAPRTSWSYFRARCYTEGLAKARISRLRGPARSRIRRFRPPDGVNAGPPL